MPSPICDAYCHVGRPRFGSPADAFGVNRANGVDKLVLVLGPLVPVYDELFAAIQEYGDDVRCVGIPFGNTAQRQTEIADMLVEAGTFGMRLSGQEFLAQPHTAQAFGEAGRWIYSNGIAGNSKAAAGLVAWLEQYPDSCVAAPHFLRPTCTDLHGPLLDLLAHPRFFPIFSRHGGMGSQVPYPHEDLRPWTEAIIDRTGWDRVMYGSEYPVIHWRNESLPDCLSWLGTVTGAPAGEIDRFRGGNADREIFDRPPPPVNQVSIPSWVDEEFDRTRTVPLFETGQLAVSMDSFNAIHPGYAAALRRDPSLRFAAYVESLLGSVASRLGD